MSSRKVASASSPDGATPAGAAETPTASPTPVDRLSTLLDAFRVRATLFHTGPLCGRSTFEAVPDRAFLHVLRRGRLQIEHRGHGAGPRDLVIDEPTLLLYPRALHHAFVNPPRDGSDFTCATLHFDGGDRNPIVAALPALVRAPLDAVPGLRPALDLLFAEADQPRCGSRLLADRLFEVVLIQLLRWIVDHPQAAGVTAGLVMGLHEPRLARALTALHARPQDDWTLARMAHEAGMSRSAFADAFRTRTGQTPAAYLADWRLSLATAQLRAGRPQKLVAADLGYASTSSLSRAFRLRHGLGPRAWLGRPAPTGDEATDAGSLRQASAPDPSTGGSPRPAGPST